MLHYNNYKNLQQLLDNMHIIILELDLSSIINI